MTRKTNKSSVKENPQTSSFFKQKIFWIPVISIILVVIGALFYVYAIRNSGAGFQSMTEMEMSVGGHHLALRVSQHNADGDHYFAIYVYKQADGVWSLEQEISYQTMAGLDDGFTPMNFAINDNYLVAGDLSQDVIHIFARRSGWSLEQTITESDLNLSTDSIQNISLIRATDNNLAFRVAFDGDEAEDIIYIFEHHNGVWSIQQEFSSQAIAALHPSSHKLLGDLWLHDLDDDRLLITGYNEEATGRTVTIYMFFKRHNGVWSLEQVIYDDPVSASGLDLYQSTWGQLDLRGDRLVMGCCRNDRDEGTINIFKRHDGVWSTEQKISYPKTANFLDIDGDRLAIEDDDKGVIDIYEYDNGAWFRSQDIGDSIITEKSIDQLVFRGDYLLVLVSDDNNEPGIRGVVYVFKYNGATWSLSQKLDGSQLQP